MTIPLRLTPPQSSVFDSAARFRILVAGRRFGKTHLAITELMRWAWGPGRLAWYIAPTRTQAKMIAWSKLKAIARPWIVGSNETELSVNLVSGGSIRLHGAEKYDALRGPGLDGVVFDEFADIDLRAWTEVVRPMLSDRMGSALFIGTPKGFNHFRDMYYAARDDSVIWNSWQFTTIEGGNVAPSEIEMARHDLDARTFRQEYEATFENLAAGQVYYAFDRAANIAPVAFDPALPLRWSLDFNIDPMCSVICQIAYRGEGAARTGQVNVLDELYLPNSNTPQACEEFLTRIEPYRDLVGRGRTLDLTVYGDASGSARQTAGGGAPSDWATIRRELAAHPDLRVSYKYKTKNPFVKDRVAAVNGMLCNASGESRIAIAPHCKRLIRDFERVAWKPGTTLIDKDAQNELTHLSDSFGYLIESEFPVKRNLTLPRIPSLTQQSYWR